MAAAFPIPLTAAQIGTYFVGQYYQILQQQPEIVHQFYSDASTVLRIDGHTRETATAMLQIHSLIMSISYTGVEIKTIHSLESWSGGVLVMISGSVQLKNFNGSRKFMQTFFLAPQETGFFILNDIFHFFEEEQAHHHHHHHPTVLLAQNNLNAKLSAPPSNQDSVPSYMLSREVLAREFAPAEVKENGPVDNFNVLPEQPQQQVPESENIHEGSLAVESNGPTQNAANNAVQDHSSASVDEVSGEQHKHTYASILRVVKGQSPPSVGPPTSASSKNLQPAASEWDQILEPVNQQSAASPTAYERSEAEAAEEVAGFEDGELKSVYVRNLPSTVSESEIEEEFRKFGRIRTDGVVIRGRKDLGVCYAFVEFEDMVGVHDAVKAATAQVAGRQVYIEERRPNSNIPSRSRRGRGRGNYQSESSRTRFGSRNLNRGSASAREGGDREYNRSRGNGFYRPNHRQERGSSGQQISSRSGQNPQE
ncbi:nuclear transport factor 2-like isoform X2 [Punica granatum]|uniref:Nuclear transport factor 2-like isoform X2 n=1 Tax=Punica granatum TaxID=22663 RepID=A0A6P8DX10_PUNGR|nr:nuclear transport factor 2-like isoform X2 [Punica granatum]